MFDNAAIAIFVSMILDGLDGRVARMTNTQSKFGEEYDSLADMVAFGVAPGLVAFFWSLNNLGQVGWAITFIYVAGAALRLARFNTQIGSVDKKLFRRAAQSLGGGVRRRTGVVLSCRGAGQLADTADDFVVVVVEC